MYMGGRNTMSIESSLLLGEKSEVITNERGLGYGCNSRRWKNRTDNCSNWND